MTTSTTSGAKAGRASTTPVQVTPIQPASAPSVSDASGLLPAHAIAHTAITLATRSGPAALDSSVLVMEFASRQETPAPAAAAKLTQIDGVATKKIMHTPSAASAYTASWIFGRCRGRRSEPSTLPPPSAAMNHPDQFADACR